MEWRCLVLRSSHENLGQGQNQYQVSAQLTGLEANVTYHWRLSVRDLNGEAFAVDHTFVFDTSSAELPDGRAYEKVSPSVRDGALLATQLAASRACLKMVVG